MDEIRPRGGYYPGDWVRPRPNPGGWTPIADTQEIHTGNRSTNRAGTFELYDAPHRRAPARRAGGQEHAAGAGGRFRLRPHGAGSRVA